MSSGTNPPSVFASLKAGYESETSSPQLTLPLQRKTVVQRTDDAERVRRFYTRFGHERVSQQKINAGMKLLVDLVENQGYSWENIDFALEWLFQNRDQVEGDVRSLNLLPHVIDRALKEQQAVHAQEKKRQARLQKRQKFPEEQDPQKPLEDHLELLSPTERDRLRTHALADLAAQGIKKPFLDMEGLIRSEMLRLLAEEHS